MADDPSSVRIPKAIVALVGKEPARRYAAELVGSTVCSRCGGPLLGETMLVAEALEGDEVPVITLAVVHRACAEGPGDPRARFPAAADARVVLASRPGPSPRAMAIVDLGVEVAGFPVGGADPVDLRISGLLASGFGIMAGEIADTTGPAAAGWRAGADGTRLRIASSEVLLFEGDVVMGVRWMALGGADGAITVLVGSRIGLGDEGEVPDMARLERAVGAGRVVVARVPWSSEWPGERFAGER